MLPGTWRDDRPSIRVGIAQVVGADQARRNGWELSRSRADSVPPAGMFWRWCWLISTTSRWGSEGHQSGLPGSAKLSASPAATNCGGEHAPGLAPDLSLGAGTRRRYGCASRLALGRRACLAGGWGGHDRWRQVEERTERSAGPVGLARRALIGQRWRPRPLISYLPPGVAPACRARRRVHADQRPTTCPPCWRCWARGARSDWLVRRSRPAADKRCVGAASAQRPSGVPRADAYLCCASMRAMRARGQAMRDQPCFYRAAQSNGRPDHTPHPGFCEAVPCAHSRTPH